MCSICGIYDPKSYGESNKDMCLKMNQTLAHRGPDSNGAYFYGKVSLAHNRLAVIDPENGSQPMSARFAGREYVIVYNGEIYNTDYLRKELAKRGVTLKTRCDTEIVLYAYIIWKEKCAEKLDGIFAFCVFDKNSGKIFIARDRFGVKPFFYTFKDNSFYFASEIKALLECGAASPKVDTTGLWQLLYMSPSRIGGSGIFRDISELKAAHCGYFDLSGLHIYRYWTPKAQTIHENAGEAALHTRFLLEKSIKEQLVSDVPLSVLLSGGLDSSIVSSVAALCYRENSMTLDTYSFEYEGSKDNFGASEFIPASDDEYAVYMAKWLGTEHTILTCPTKALIDNLYAAVDARDFPGQADIDSSLLYFCNRIKKKHTVVLSGECADEIFGGYPWFYKPEMLNSGYFPWIHEPKLRAGLFRNEIARQEEGYAYTSEIYKNCIAECPLNSADSELMNNSRIATWLSTEFFMQQLLERKDRMSMHSGLEIRVPFANHELFEYVFNVPWEIKFEDGIEKALLRNAMSNYLPEKILYRKKSPYPKTFDTCFESGVRQILTEKIMNGKSILSEILDTKALESFCENTSETWFGQLMGKAQMLAWLLQFDYWYEKYNVELVL